MDKQPLVGAKEGAQIVACVVGASGFLGREVISAIMRRGEASTRLSLRPDSVDEATISSIAAYLKHTNVNLVVNCAAARLHGTYDAPLIALRQANILLPQILALACARSRVPLLHIGSRWQLGEHGEGPNGPYAQSKERGEREARWICQTNEIPFSSILIRDTYGPFDPRRTLINELLQTAKGQNELLLTDGQQLIDPLHVRRVSDAVVSCGQAMVSGSPGGRYELGSPQPPTVRELVSQFEKSWGTTLSKRWGAVPPRGTELFDMVQVLPWAPGWSPAVVRKDFPTFVKAVRADWAL